MVVEEIGLHVEGYVSKILGIFLSKALKQTKAGPRISRTLFLVVYLLVLVHVIIFIPLSILSYYVLYQIT